MGKLKAIIFDLDDTLYSERDYVKSGFIAVDEYLQTKTGKEGFFRAAWTMYLNKVRGNTFNMALDEIGIGYDESFIAELVDTYRLHLPEITLSKEVLKTIKSLEKDYSLGLITDGHHHSQRKKIEALGLESYFDCLIVTDELAANRKGWKPATDAFELVQEHFDALGSELIYIADNLNKDFIAPNKLGWQSILYRSTQGEYLSDQEFPQENLATYSTEDFSQIMELIKGIEAGIEA